MDAPTLMTARLRLRPITIDDLETLHALWTGPQVRRWLWDDEVISRDVVEAVIGDAVASFAAHGYGHWLAMEAATEAVAGACGLRRVEATGEIELLYALAPGCWGRGYATEAARAVLRYGFEQVGLARIVAQTDVPNAASIRVLERLGMTRVRQVQDAPLTLVDYAMQAADLRP